MIIRASCLVVASVSAFSFSQINIGSYSKQNSRIEVSDPHESALQQQQIEENKEEELQNSKDEKEKEEKKINKMQRILKPEGFEFLVCDKEVTQTGLLQSLVEEVEQRRLILERKQLELYGLKEEQSGIDKLRRQLDDKTVEINMLKMRVDSLQVERKRLHEEIKQGFLAEKQLEMAKKVLKGMREKMDANASHVMGRLMVLEQEVSRLQSDGISFRDAVVEKKLESVQDVELQVVEMKRRNKELELEKRELAIDLALLRERTAALSNMTQDKIMAKVKEEVTSLRHANEELQDQVERLQKNRFNMVQKLVYQRWIHTCLRYEIQNHQNQSRKTLESQKPHEKTNPLRKLTTFHNISSNTTSAESEEIDSSTFHSSSSSQQISKKTQTFQHARRVSFNDSVQSVESTYLDGKEIPAMRTEIDNDSINLHEEGSRTEIVSGDHELHTKMPRELPMDNRVKTHVAALFFFFMLLIYFLYLSAIKY